jgi:hypothetical protein
MRRRNRQLRHLVSHRNHRPGKIRLVKISELPVQVQRFLQDADIIDDEANSFPSYSRLSRMYRTNDSV